MKFVRFAPEGRNEELKGIIEDDCSADATSPKGYRQIYGSYLQAFTVTDTVFSLDSVKLLPPVLPQNIICVDADGTAFAKAPSSLAGCGAVLKQDSLCCVPRIAYVVKNRDHSSTTGVSLYGFTLMLDFFIEGMSISHSYNGFTVLGPCVNTEYCNDFTYNGVDTAHSMDKDVLMGLSQSISFRPGDIIAFALAQKTIVKSGDRITLQCRDVTLFANVISPL